MPGERDPGHGAGEDPAPVVLVAVEAQAVDPRRSVGGGDDTLVDSLDDPLGAAAQRAIGAIVLEAPPAEEVPPEEEAGQRRPGGRA